MKYFSFLVLLTFLFVACEQEVIPIAEEETLTETANDDEQTIENRNPICNLLEFTIDKHSEEDGCCIYLARVVYTGHDKPTPLIINAFVDGVFHSNYMLNNTSGILIDICDETSSIDFYVNGQLCYSEVFECKKKRCIGCDAISVSSSKISESNNCCNYMINLNVLCDLQAPFNNFTIRRNGNVFQSLTVTQGVSIPVQVCGEDAVLYEILNANGEVCYAEQFSCNNCCPNLEFTITSRDVGTGNDGCCEVTFEVTGSAFCLSTIELSFTENNGQNFVDLEPNNPFVIRVNSCDSRGVTFRVKDALGNICFEKTPSIYCES